MSEDHLKLSSFIKSIHSDLREKSSIKGFEEAWKEHCNDEKTLEKYAEAMKILATNHWQNNFEKNCKASCRVQWVYKYCIEYFKIELFKQRQRELEIANKLEIIPEIPDDVNVETLTLLDVGSCYNPFSQYGIFQVTAIDIAPALPTVQKLDFLNTDINLPQHFDIVVFSLFLEYLPSPKLRLESCLKAYNLLKFEGLLFIITPDSKHVGANAQIMKSWRFVLAEIGFSRIKYEKLAHIHCMAFRKCLDVRISERWGELHKKFQVYDNIYIPQDFTNKAQVCGSEEEKIVVNFEFPFAKMEL